MLSFREQQEAMKNSTREELETLVKLALGRIFRLGSRPTQPGDVEQYEFCRSLIMDATELLRENPPKDTRPNWVRDRNKGAQGD